MITPKTTKGKISTLLIAFFKHKSDAPVYQLEGRRGGNSAVSIPTLENTFQNPFCKQRVVSQLLHSSRQILTLIFQEISTTLKVPLYSPAGFTSEKKVPTFFPSTISVMTWPEIFGWVPFAITTEVPPCRAHRAAFTYSKGQSQLQEIHLLFGSPLSTRLLGPL